MQAFTFRVLIALLALGLAACNRNEPEPPTPVTPAESAPSAENPALWKLHVKGDFAKILSGVKNELQAAQFQMTGEENLSLGLEKNKHLFANEEWNTIGFENVTALHFCSVVFNQEVFNVKMDWSVLCPFKLVMYTMKTAPEDVTIVMVRPTYLLANDPHPRAHEIGRVIEDRITNAIRDGSIS
jgi:uncharacterized protein (DUF302 family)